MAKTPKKSKSKEARKTAPRANKASKVTGKVNPTEVDLTDTSEFESRAAKLLANLDIQPKVELTNIGIGVLSPSSPQDVPGSPPEPVYTAKQQDDIQGNIIPGFNKDHQQFLFYRICNLKRAKRFLQWIAPLITSMEEVIARWKMMTFSKLVGICT